MQSRTTLLTLLRISFGNVILLGRRTPHQSAQDVCCVLVLYVNGVEFGSTVAFRPRIFHCLSDFCAVARLLDGIDGMATWSSLTRSDVSGLLLWVSRTKVSSFGVVSSAEIRFLLWTKVDGTIAPQSRPSLG